jgi:Fic family protein
LTSWLCSFSAVAIEAQRRSAAKIDFLLDKSRLWDELRGTMNDRQEKALQRILGEVREVSKGASARAII